MRATEPQQLEAYRRFGLNDTQIQLIAQATPKREYYFQSRAGNRVFDLNLGPVALSICGASSVANLVDADRIYSEVDGPGFAASWLRWHELDWAADLLGVGDILTDPLVTSHIPPTHKTGAA